jgi:hypothetical protein
MACPSGHELLAYHLTKLPDTQRPGIETHLDQCEFCGAELQLLESFPQADLCCCDETAALPAPLRRLAEAIMGGGDPTLRTLFEGSHEIEAAGSGKR